METLKFKTNIKCDGCIATVTPALDTLQGVNKWEVDINHPDKVLTVQSEEALSASEVISALKTKGYNADVL